MIDYCIKIPILKAKSEADFQRNEYEPIYTNETSLTSKRYTNWFLIDYLCNCKKDTRGYKNLEGNTMNENDMIYLYGNQFHTTKSKYQLDENIFVIKKLINNNYDKEIYKYLLVKLLNILRFAKYDYMIFPRDVFSNITKFKAFMKKYFKISYKVNKNKNKVDSKETVCEQPDAFRESDDEELSEEEDNEAI